MRVGCKLTGRFRSGRSEEQCKKKAEGTHTGEERWCNMDQYFVETVSSTCAVVGFFVGYAVSLAKDSKEFCQSRQGQAELSVDWEILPPLCRAGNVEVRNIQEG